jgi:hypothetical protein
MVLNNANYLALINSGNIKQVVYPVAAPTAAISDGAAAAWAWSAYVQIVAATTIPNPSWLVGVFMSTPTVEAFTADFAIATGAGGAEVDQAIFPFNEQLFAVVEGKSVTQFLPYPIRLAGQPRLSVRVRKSSAASAAGVSLKVIIATGVGT